MDKEARAKRNAARLEALQAMRDMESLPSGSPERHSMALYTYAAQKVWQDLLDLWEESMRAF